MTVYYDSYQFYSNGPKKRNKQVLRDCVNVVIFCSFQVGDINVSTLISYTTFNDECGESPGQFSFIASCLLHDQSKVTRDKVSLRKISFLQLHLRSRVDNEGAGGEESCLHTTMGE